MTQKPQSNRKPKSDTETTGTTVGVDDRHLQHPHAITVDPAGGAVFDGTIDASAADGAAAPRMELETPTADGDPDAIGHVVFKDCPDPAEDDSSAGGDGVGAAVRNDCDDPAGGPAVDTTAAPQSLRATTATGDTSVGAGMGAAVLPDGRVVGDARAGAEVREGYGLVFSI
jgi:hypothetical protein